MRCALRHCRLCKCQSFRYLWMGRMSLFWATTTIKTIKWNVEERKNNLGKSVIHLPPACFWRSSSSSSFNTAELAKFAGFALSSHSTLKNPTKRNGLGVNGKKKKTR